MIPVYQFLPFPVRTSSLPPSLSHCLTHTYRSHPDTRKRWNTDFSRLFQVKTLGQGRKEIARHIFKLDGVALLSARSTRDELFTTESWGPLHDKNSLLATVLTLWSPLQASQRASSLFRSQVIMMFIFIAKEDTFIHPSRLSFFFLNKHLKCQVLY